MLLYGGVVSQAQSNTPIFAMPAVRSQFEFTVVKHTILHNPTAHTTVVTGSTVVVRDRCNQDRSGSTNHVRMFASD